MDAPRKHRQLVTRDTFAILVALAAGHQTGSEVQSRVISDTPGSYLRTTSLYTTLHRLEEMNLVESHSKRYTLSDKGWQVLRTETQTFESLVKQAKNRIISSGRGRW